MTNYRIGIIARCLAALIIGALCLMGIAAFPLAIVVLLPTYCGAAVWAMRDCKVALLSGLLLLCANISSGMGLILWLFANLLLALISLIVLPLRILWNLLALIASLFSGAEKKETEPRQKKVSSPHSTGGNAQSTESRVITTEKKEKKDKEKEEEEERKKKEEEEEQRVPVSVLHLEGPADKLSFVSSGKQWMVSAAMLNQCSPGVADRVDAIPFIIRETGSGSGGRWLLTVKGAKACVLHNGTPTANGDSITLRRGDRVSLSPVESPLIPFLNLKVRFEVLIKTIKKQSHNI